MPRKRVQVESLCRLITMLPDSAVHAITDFTIQQADKFCDQITEQPRHL